MADIDNLTAAVGFYIIFCISITYITTAYTKKPLQKQGFIDFIWRRKRDSNPRYAINVYTLSRGAPSATRPLLRVCYVVDSL